MFLKQSFFLFCLFLVLIPACREIKDPFVLQPIEDSDYYPLELGRYWVYSVDSIIFDENAPKPIDTISFILKEVVSDTFFDLDGRMWYRIEAFERASDTLPWKLRQVLAATLHGKEGLRLENDLTFIKLLLPLTPFKSWDGNKLFDPATIVTVSGETIEMFKYWEYEVLSAGVPDTINGQMFGEVATISQANSENLIELRYALEKYARGVGLVERELRILDSQNTDEFIPWEQKAEKGFILYQKLVEAN